MDIVTMIDQYKELLDRKDALADQTKENNKAIQEARDALAQAMIDAEMPKVSRNGFLYSLQDKTKYNKKACDDEEFFSVLEENGLGDLIKRTVDARTLSSAMAAAAEENDGVLPEEYEDYISVYQFYDIAKRKETNKTAKRAKQKEE
ncbi:hypothetical protein BRYFOR_07515 [Marvinbryantia formatexigens DSM 14469]|uniref:Uncharacterized protein n=1 Tax=Marvinbryantia formatexigens DSM 14469 TaxID=478749 RepID=C6LFV5_9FIRM|nr:hypothetical protein [Marvinbryantia formatexigens]EET60319.1 hypothetical protein BRYFOR_07515 [Marvinbryantia formatexigens DSM 14469]UWO25341.1 hypothetical protein NQ534_02260 [Marvinbryantia formatexigens DSM 14469]SDG99998.1 hypothetical protein SAMN05660368_03664 [Marvinbryantia formatexigens]